MITSIIYAERKKELKQYFYNFVPKLIFTQVCKYKIILKKLLELSLASIGYTGVLTIKVCYSEDHTTDLCAWGTCKPVIFNAF